MTGTHKLRIKIGDAEFEAEGSEESVKAQYDAFLNALLQSPGSTFHQSKHQDPPPANGDEDLNGAPSDELTAKAFEVNEELVSLRYLPQGATKEADALLLLIYGYAQLKGVEQVLGTRLLKAARQSGMTMDRVDRHIAKHDAYLLKGGARKGRRYSLNNQGKIKAQEILKVLLSE